jgi:serine/threonine protein kinase
MHCLIDAYVKDCERVEFKNILLYRFEIYFQNKVREYYCQDEAEFKQWIKMINIATGYASLDSKYEIIEKMSSGKFGLIRRVKNIETGEINCLKIINKKSISNKDLQELKTETEIMKICQHPNLVRLDNLYEDQENKYVGNTFTFIINVFFPFYEIFLKY